LATIKAKPAEIFIGATTFSASWSGELTKITMNLTLLSKNKNASVQICYNRYEEFVWTKGCYVDTNVLELYICIYLYIIYIVLSLCMYACMCARARACFTACHK
jgi:hypothetical protein